MKTKISDGHEVEREIKVTKTKDKIAVVDAFKNILTKNNLDFMRYWDNTFQNTSEARKRIQQLFNEIEGLEISIKQNEELLEALRPEYKSSMIQHKLEIQKQQRDKK